jgi:hypothetical protein
MKLDKTAREKMISPAKLLDEGPQYPWGLSLSLDNESLDKLGVENLPKVGATMRLEARVSVSSVSSNEGMDKTVRRSVSLQVTAMALSGTAADALYEEK